MNPVLWGVVLSLLAFATRVSFAQRRACSISGLRICDSGAVLWISLRMICSVGSMFW